VTPADIALMRNAGWNDLQIAETIHVTALFASFNRVVSAFGLPPQELLKMFAEESNR
jgi:alkylhydroperoxidase family enzyme